jgi:ribonuclease P protein component
VASRQDTPPRDHRIRRRAEFERVYSDGRKIYGRYMILFCVPGAEPPARFGLSVSRRVGGAVERNLVKRRMREICRRELAAPGAAHAEYVLTLRREAVAAPFEELRLEVSRLAARARKGR